MGRSVKGSQKLRVPSPCLTRDLSSNGTIFRLDKRSLVASGRSDILLAPVLALVEARSTQGFLGNRFPPKQGAFALLAWRVLKRAFEVREQLAVLQFCHPRDCWRNHYLEAASRRNSDFPELIQVLKVFVCFDRRLCQAEG